MRRQDKSYMSSDLRFKNGNVNKEDDLVHLRVVTLKNVSKEGRNSDDYSEDFENRSFISSNYTLGLPLKKLGNNFESNLTPKLSLSTHKTI